MIRKLLFFPLLILFFSCFPINAKEITLEEAVKIALKKNYILKTYEENLKDAISNLKIKSNLANINLETQLLTGSDSNNQTYVYREAKLNFLQNAQTGEKLSLVNNVYSSSNYSQPILYNSIDLQFKKPLLKDGGFVSGRYEIDKALRELAIADIKYFLARQDLINEIAKTYYDVIKKKFLITVNEEAVKNAENSLYRAARLLEEKMITKIEKIRAEVQYAKSKNALIEAKKDWQNVKDKLAILIGLTLKENIDVIYEIKNKKLEYNEETLINDALAFHKELKVLSIEEQQREGNLKYAENQIRPELDLVSKYNMIPSQSYNYNLPTWSVGLQAKYPFRDFSNEENLKSAKRKIPLKKEETKLKTQEIIESVKKNLRELNASYEQITINEQNLNAAEKGLKISMKRWEEGLDTNRDVIESQQNLIQAQASLITSKIDYILVQIEVEKSAGYDLIRIFKLENKNEN